MKFREIKKVIRNLLIAPVYLFIFLPLYWLSYIFPRNKKLWLFGAWEGHRYTDSSRYLFEYVCANEPDIRAVWLSRENSLVNMVRQRNGEAYLINSIKGYLLSCLAGTVIVNVSTQDINQLGISRAKKIQLWHGSPLKKIRLDEYSKKYRIIVNVLQRIFPYRLPEWDIIVSPSPVISERFVTAFGVAKSNVKVTGSPRGDVILASNPAKVSIIQFLKENKKVEKVILYAPTWRKGNEEAIELFSELDRNRMERCLAVHNAVLLVKWHYVHRALKPVINELKESQIVWLSEEAAPDINELLPYVDVLITDYSGVYFDYLLLNRPIIFAPFDLKEYVIGDRDLYEDYDKAIVGPKCENWNDLMNVLDTVLAGKDEFRESRIIAQKKYNTFVDTKNCKRVVSEIKKVLK
ncbi:MAG: CDP-glycerol glycerophosphotransferase family protein [Syntrophomonadaceae bacterium]|nr:CDP-glycerol glycerophosphotransferase family protein [Syntrophomonadaceae bacterium]